MFKHNILKKWNSDKILSVVAMFVKGWAILYDGNRDTSTPLLIGDALFVQMRISIADIGKGCRIHRRTAKKKLFSGTQFFGYELNNNKGKIGWKLKTVHS